MLGLHLAFLLVVAGSTATLVALALLNVRYASCHIHERETWLRETLGVTEPDRLDAYHRLRTGTTQLRRVLGLGIILLVLYSGLFGSVVAWLISTLGNGPIAGVALLAGLTLSWRALAAPFDGFGTFAVEEAFGFNEQSPRLFLRDALLETAIGVVLVAAIGGAVLVALEWFPEWWWLAATGVVAGFALLSQVLLPRVIMPLFYDFEPVDSGDLREAVEDVFDRAGFTCEDIYVMDASSRSGHSNAFFTGFGATKRVVLFDTLLEQLETRQLQSVLAHELAHWKRGHVWQRIGVSVLEAGVLLFLAAQLMETSWLYGLFGVPAMPAAGLVLAGLWLGPLSRVSSLLTNRLWLANEREADAFAVEVMGDGTPLAEALATLTEENLANPFPHPWYEALAYQHPPVPERIRTLTETADSTPADAEAGESAEVDST
ncbi:MAG: M48 family metallopeptidase [Halodesulfurarchaeum sp.]